MFTYRCPACGKHHTVDKAFEQTFESKCLRCGTLIFVTPELVQSQGAVRSFQSASVRPEAITKSPGDSVIQVASKNGLATETRSDEPALDAPSLPDEDPAPEFESRKNGRGNLKDMDDKSRNKKSAKNADKQKEMIEKLAKAEDALEPRRGTPPAKSPPAKGPRPRWQMIAAIAAGVLVLVGGGYMIFGGKSSPPKRQAAKAPPKKAPKPILKAAPKTEVPKNQTLPAKSPDEPQLVLSAPRLSAELAANTSLADNKYAGKFLEVSGLFAKLEQKEGLRPPARPHVVFDTTGAPISCDLDGTPTPLAAWKQLKAKAPITIRGKYEQKGYLRDCFLMPQYTATADKRYKGKIIEVTGRVAKRNSDTGNQQFPQIVLEGETISTLEIHCLFRTTEASEVSRIQPGSLLTIQGKCGGRHAGNGHVRLDNCQLVYTSAPPENMPRIEAVPLIREYEEDLKPIYLPPPGEEEKIDTIWTIPRLVKDYSADPKAFLKKYQNRILRIQGKRQKQGNSRENTVVLISGDTDLTFRVEGHFRLDAMETVSKRREGEIRIRGLFTGKVDDKHIRLDNCQFDMPKAAGPEVTADYLSHKWGRTFAVDVVTFDVLVNRKIGDLVEREFHVQGKDGLTEIVVTHSGLLPGKSLFAEGVQEKWVQPKKVKIRAPQTTGIYYRRLQAGFVELGTPHQNEKNKIETTWLPVLKLEARVGDKWKWDSPAGLREYELVKFGEFQGQPTAVVREILTTGDDLLHPIETLHVYAKGFGEVERRHWKQLDQRGGKKLLSEMKWVDHPLAQPDSKPHGKSPGKPPVPTVAPKPLR